MNRWLHWFWARALDSFRAYLAADRRIRTELENMMQPSTLIAPVRKSIIVKAAQADAFKAFTSFAWWPKSYSILPSRSAQRQVTLEPREGGRWYERGEDGSECDWGKVLVFIPPRRLVFTWQITAQYTFDPNVETEVEVRFTRDGSNETNVELEHRLLERFGASGEKVRADVDGPGGWAGLLESFAQAVR